MDSRLYWIWMQQALTPGNYKVDELLRTFGNAQAVYEANENDLLSFGLTPRERARLNDKSMDTASAILKYTLKNGDWVMTPDDQMFPSLLCMISGIPLVLYGRGEMPDLNILPTIAIVGTRETTGYGRRATALLAGGLALGGAAIVSGGARGVDAISHEATLAAGGITVAVQACGLDINYPKRNQELRQRIIQTGAVLTEFPPGTVALKHNFVIRNRLISGMALGTCVTEAGKKSGALITAHHAFEQGRDVYAIAGDMLTGRSTGTDILIQQGAQLITSAVEILEEYHSRFPEIISPKAAAYVRSDPRFRTVPSKARKEVEKKQMQDIKKDACEPVKQCVCPNSASENAKMVFQLIDAPHTLNEIIGMSGLSASQVLTLLTELEMLGCICCRPGQIYARC